MAIRGTLFYRTNMSNSGGRSSGGPKRLNSDPPSDSAASPGTPREKRQRLEASIRKQQEELNELNTNRETKLRKLEGADKSAEKELKSKKQDLAKTKKDVEELEALRVQIKKDTERINKYE